MILGEKTHPLIEEDTPMTLSDIATPISEIPHPEDLKLRLRTHSGGVFSASVVLTRGFAGCVP